MYTPTLESIVDNYKITPHPVGIRVRQKAGWYGDFYMITNQMYCLGDLCGMPGYTKDNKAALQLMNQEIILL